MKTKLVLMLATLAIAGAVFYSNTTSFAQATTPLSPLEEHNVMLKALRGLVQAQKDMEAVKGDFGGHRAAALKACTQAINECKLALGQPNQK